MDLDDIQVEQYVFSQEHFPEQMNLMHMAVALAGEVGEFCNWVKKIDRGDFEMPEGYVVPSYIRDQMALELADILIYLVDCASALQVQLSTYYVLKASHNRERFKDRAGSTNQSDQLAAVEQLQSDTHGAGAFVNQADLPDFLPDS